MTIIIDIDDYIYDTVCRADTVIDADVEKVVDAFQRGMLLETWIELWLKGFNTDSATDCFNAVQQLKKEIE
jgi:hypothetical protein